LSIHRFFYVSLDEKSGKIFHSHLSLHFLSKANRGEGVAAPPATPSIFFFTYRKFGKLAFIHSRISSLNASKTPHIPPHRPLRKQYHPINKHTSTRKTKSKTMSKKLLVVGRSCASAVVLAFMAICIGLLYRREKNIFIFIFILFLELIFKLNY
jgi:hypothetical protein